MWLLERLGRRTSLGHGLEQTLGIVLVFPWSGAVVASGVAGFPLFLLPARSTFEGVDEHLEDVARLRHPFTARVASPAPESGETRVELAGGLALVVPR